MLTISIIALVVFTLLSGFFSASETSLFSLSTLKVRAYRKDSAPRKRLIARLLERPRGLLVTILMCNVLANLLVQNFASNTFGQLGGWGLKVGLPLLLTLLFGEIIPKSIALPNNEKISDSVAPTIGFLHKYLGPFRRGMTWLTGMISRAMFFFLKREQEISDEEMEHALQASQQHGVLTTDEAEFIEGYLDYQRATVKSVVRPRGELLTYDTHDPLERLIDLFKVQECSRVPVVEGDLDTLLGVIEASEFFLHQDGIKTPEQLKDHLRKPLFVPETMNAKVLWQKLSESGEQLAVVVDEYGSIAGIVTREDLVEEVVGEIADRRDARHLFTRASSDVVIASGKMELDDFNELFNTDLKSDTSLVTLGGWLTQHLGHIPEAGTQFVYEQFLFHILSAEPNRVRRVYIRKLNEGEDE